MVRIKSIDVVRLMGGLGNQMFQYALGRRLAITTGREVRFDVENGFRNDTYGRKYALEAFKTEIVRAVPRDIPLGMNWPSPWHRIAKAGWLMIPRWRLRVMYERTLFQFDETVVSQKNGPVYYFGYWQNVGYFSPIKDVLRREFSLRTPLRDPVRLLLQEIMGCRAVSLHVRRYLDINCEGKLIEGAEENHGVCPVDYYRRAVGKIGTRSETVCYVFSDDPQWAKANLRLPIPCRYVADICRCSDIEEMLLMASCQHHVISNSSFGWWGAWLGSNPEKVVVAPKSWIRNVPKDVVDVCPRDWVRL